MTRHQQLVPGALREHFTGTGTAKVGYPSMTQATKVAREWQAKLGSKRRPYRAYRCTVCDLFHVGRVPPHSLRLALAAGIIAGALVLYWAPAAKPPDTMVCTYQPTVSVP